MADPQKHLLLVEDEKPLRQAVAEQLADRGYRVEQADSGEAAIAKLADFAYDIIVTDLRLPGVDGSAVVEAAVERYPHIIAIVVTGFGTVKDAVEAIKRGAWDFVSKPFQIDELLHVLDSAIEQPHKGTLFLDEVGTMSPGLQMKLLRVLQEREFERVGDSHTIKVDVRVIAATNTDLGRMVAEGQFREDLFYRLNVIPVQLPPLRDRKEDIPLLVRHFLDKFRGDAPPTRPAMTVSQEAMRQLMSYQWPGNVRQLENAIERATAFTVGRSQIDAADLPPEIQNAQEPALSSSV